MRHSTIRGDSACLLGDAIHTVKPYFGLGLNSALEDIAVLERSLSDHRDDRAAALVAYSKQRAVQAKTLVKISRQLDGGFLTFVLPMIIDSILHKSLPALFAPSTLTLLQNENLSYTQVWHRKIRDRVVQSGLFLAVIWGLKEMATKCVSWLSTFLLRHSMKVATL